MGLLFYGFWSVIKKSLVQDYQDFPYLTSLLSDSVLASSFLCRGEIHIITGGQTLDDVSIIITTSGMVSKGKRVTGLYFLVRT